MGGRFGKLKGLLPLVGKEKSDFEGGKFFFFFFSFSFFSLSLSRERELCEEEQVKRRKSRRWLKVS